MHSAANYGAATCWQIFFRSSEQWYEFICFSNFLAKANKKGYTNSGTFVFSDFAITSDNVNVNNPEYQNVVASIEKAKKDYAYLDAQTRLQFKDRYRPVQSPFSFVQFLAGGMEICLMVSVDFTMSNGIPSNPSSLHYLNGPQPTQYEQAIMSVGSIVADYDAGMFCFVFCTYL